jgi:hypothetical protein
VGPSEKIQAEAEAIPESDGKCSQDTPTLGRNWGKINVPTVIRKGIGRMNVPSVPGTPRNHSRLEPEARSSKEKISPPAGEPAGRKTLSVWQAWKGMRKTRTDWSPFYWAPRSLWSK